MEKPVLKIEAVLTKEQEEVFTRLLLQINTAEPQNDIRDLAPVVREIVGESYRVGCGGSHIYIHVLDKEDELRRKGEFPGHARVAIIRAEEL